METKTSAKDFFINLGAIVALGTIVFNLVDLLFTVINKAYPLVTGSNYYDYSSYSISFPVSTLIIFSPIYILLMWLLERSYRAVPEKRNLSVRKWLTYITLFFAGLAIAGDLVTILYYFIDGQELTTGFVLKIITVFIIALAIFLYYIFDSMGRLDSKLRKIWTGIFCVLILGSIVWGFSVLGSPRTQQLLKYDEQRISDLQNINNQVQEYYQLNGSIPGSISDLSSSNNYYVPPTDPQTKNSYEYHLIGQSAKAYSLCAVFNKDSTAQENEEIVPNAYSTWSHPAGRYCFTEAIPLSQYKKVPFIPAQ